MKGANSRQDGRSNTTHTTTRMIRVMIVDDSLTARTVLGKIVDEAPDFVLSATANTAEQAIAKLSQLDVDVILLDLEMPGIGGLAALPEILERAGNARIMVVSSLTAEGAEATIAALSLGAADTVLKPKPSGFTPDYRGELADRIRALGSSSGAKSSAKIRMRGEVPKSPRAPTKRTRIISIGGSTGGIHSMCQFLNHLPQGFDPTILITQHLPQSFIPIFARQIETASSRKTRVAEDGMPFVPGEILVAPGDGHLVAELSSGQPVTRISRHRVPNGCCPSVDPMFESLAKVFGSQMIGVVLSGMGRDGVIGARHVVEAGGIILAQNPKTCAVWGMPGAAAEAGLASAVASPEDLANWILSRKMVSI